MTSSNQVMPKFDDLGIAPNLLKAILAKYTTPTPIQAQVIPEAIEGSDIVGIAQTGTGKTLAFGIPMLQRLAADKGQGLILLPTRELALQVEEALSMLGRPFGVKTCVLIGGASMNMQIQNLRRNPHIIVATPGRLYDHMQQRTLSLDKVRIVVLDEADRMLDIGFLPQIKQILRAVPTERQTLLFSATMPTAIAHIATTYMKLPLRIEVAPAGTPASHIEQHVIFALKDSKMQLLDKMLMDHEGTILVFSRTKHGAKKIAAGVRAMGHTAAEIHSNLSLAKRQEALAGFKSGKYRVLVATDIAARGIDVNNISLVINYDLPDNNEDYVHRIGRTGRAGKSGKAISFAAPSEWPDIAHIEKLIKKKINVAPTPELPPRRANVSVVEDRPRMSTGPRGGFGGYSGARRSSSGGRSSSGRSSSRGGFGPRRPRR